MRQKGKFIEGKQLLEKIRKDFGEEVYKDITAPPTIGKPRMSWVCYKILKKIWKEDYRRNRNRGGRKSHNTVQTYDDGNVLIRVVGRKEEQV